MKFPDLMYDSIYQIPYDKLYAMGIRGLVFDIDNTLAEYADKRPSVKAASLIKRLQGMGFHVGLLSNNTSKRVTMYNEHIKLASASFACKPHKGGLRRVMEEMGTAPDQTAVIGDQLFTDIWCGKGVGATAIMVKPISDKDMVTVKLKRMMERIVMKKYLQSHQNSI